MAKQTEHVQLFSDSELSRLERDYPHGLTVSQIIGLFGERGVVLTESNLRKYVQLGLLPGSRRVGRGPGLHRGSQGLYPTHTVRLLQQIRGLASSGLTIAQIAEMMRTEVMLVSLDVTMTRYFAELGSGVEALPGSRAKTNGAAALRQELAAARRDWQRFRAAASRLNRALTVSSNPSSTSPATG